VEDVRAVIDAVGGHAHVLGFSSGAALALEAARSGAPVDRLVVFEAPFIVDDTRAPNDLRLPERVQEMVDRGQRGKAVSTFMRVVGAPAPMIALMHLMPVWRKLTAIAHTLPYDLSIVVPLEQGEPLPAGYYDAVAAPTLVLLGGKSPQYMRSGQAAIVAAVDGARLAVLAGQTHMVKPAVVAPVVGEFLQQE
jgi:pimeloyl-ACP methyl ester carboxylesterase